MNIQTTYIITVLTSCIISDCSFMHTPIKTTPFNSVSKPTVLPFKNNNNKVPSIEHSVVPSLVKTIKENRSNGQVTKITVENGKFLPDYYIYPSNQKKLNLNYGPDKDLAPPTWQISW